ncbi:MAG: hypothetical protein ACRETT_11500 [Steroidobacteraceae bacterium]
MAKDINHAVREVCLSFPEAEEYDSYRHFALKRMRSKLVQSI